MNATKEDLLFDLETYITSNGWRKIKSSANRLDIYAPLDSNLDGMKLLLPDSPRYSDSLRYIESAIRTLTEIDGTDYEAFVRSLESYNKDALLFRITASDRTDSIPIAHAQAQIAGMEKLLLYAASSEEKHLPHYSKPAAGAETFLHHCEFGHTFRGSFGFTVLLRVADRFQNRDLLSNPLPRRVVERVGHGIEAIGHALESNSASAIVDSYEAGLNARMCDALVEISIGGTSEYAVEIDWSMAMPPDSAFTDLRPLTITPVVVEILKEASLKLKRVEPHDYVFEAYVSDLHCVKDPKSESARRKVTLIHDHSDHGRIEIGIYLDRADYISAVEAHRDRRKLSVRGRLQRVGSAWSMADIINIIVLGGS